MGKIGGKCLGQCLSSFPDCLLTSLVENQVGEQEWVGRRKQAPLLPGKVPIPSLPLLSPGAASPKQCLGGSICLPAPPPSPPQKSLFLQQAAVPPSKERHIFQCQRRNASRVGCWSPMQSVPTMLAEITWADCLLWWAQWASHKLILQHLILMVLKTHVGIRLYSKERKVKNMTVLLHSL